MVSRSRNLRVTVVFMVNTDSVLVSSFPSATVDGGYDGSYTRRMARSYGSKWDALRGHVRTGVKVLDFGCGMPENARLLRDLVEGAGGEYYCHDAHPDVEKAMRVDGGFRHVSAGDLDEHVGAFVFMSSVVHEMLTPSCKSGNVANAALFELVGRLVAPSGCIVVRDWADYAAGAQDGSLPASLDLVDEGAAREVAQWVDAMVTHGVIAPGYACVMPSASPGGWALAGERASVCEVFLHAVWGLSSIDRESRERYSNEAFGSPGGFVSRFYVERGFAVEGCNVFYDEGFSRHGARLFRLGVVLPCATKAVTVLRKGVR